MNQKDLDLLTIEGNIHALELAIKALMQNCGFVPAPETIEGLRRTAETLSRQRGGEIFNSGARSTFDAIFGEIDTPKLNCPPDC